MKVVILGGTVAGLIAGFELKRRGYQVTIVEENDPGYDILRAPPVVRNSESFTALLDLFELSYSEYRLRSGILLRGEIVKHDAFASLGRRYVRQVQADIYKKSRLVDLEESQKFGDLLPRGTAIRFDWVALIKRLTIRLRDCIRRERVTIVEPDVVRTNYSDHFFDHLLVLLPLWETQGLVSWDMPDALSVAVNNVIVRAKQEVSPWDLVWTPYTPEGLVHSVEQHEDGYHVHFSGQWKPETSVRLTGDLNFLFPGGWLPVGKHQDLPGFMFELSEDPVWPSKVLPLGTFAEWTTKSTIETVIDQVSNYTMTWRSSPTWQNLGS